MRSTFLLVPLAFFALLLAPPVAVSAPTELHSEFKIPESGALRESVEFWLRIYASVDSKQGLMHDAKYPRVVYRMLEFRGRNEPRGRTVLREKKRIRALLMRLHDLGVEADPSREKHLTEDEREIYRQFAGIDEPNRFLNAAHYKRLRFQLGQKDNFRAGLIESGRYLPFMEEIFISRGLPYELTRLPFVESSFNTRARSKVGASGIWQFMRTTGANFMRIDDAADERNDPLRATEAASELLKINHASLGNWPLAVTAYNHGRTGIMRAVRRVGSDDLQAIREQYKSRSFGFASGNFFACLLAAIEIERNPTKYFGELDRERPHAFFEVKLPDAIRLKDLVSFLKLDRKALLDLNPALTDLALQSKTPITAGYRLRLPNSGDGTADQKAAQQRIFLDGFQRIPASFRKSKPTFEMLTLDPNPS